MNKNLFYFLYLILLNDQLIEKMLLKFVNQMVYGYRLIQMNQYLIHIKFVNDCFVFFITKIFCFCFIRKNVLLNVN